MGTRSSPPLEHFSTKRFRHIKPLAPRVLTIFFLIRTGRAVHGFPVNNELDQEKMMKNILICFLLLLSVAASASADESMGWRQNGKPIPNEDARKSVNGFGAALIITPDVDWKAKWNTPADTSPRFSTVDKLKIGSEATILIFFANPMLNPDDNVDVTCDVKITRPNTKVTENKGLRGFTGKLHGVTTNTYLTESIIKFVGEPSDPIGEWIIDVTVHDNYRHVSVPLRTKFELTK